MYPSVEEQLKHAYGSHYNPGSSYPTNGYPQPAVTVGVPVYNPHNDTNNYPHIPPPQQQQERHPSEWSTGLCNCGGDCGNCCVTCLCPCITFGQIAEITDSGSTSCGVSGALYALLLYFTGCTCCCCYSCFYRTKLRTKFNLKENPCGDFLVHCFCECCALCQEYRELKKRGFDPALGWVGNMEKREQSASQTRIPTAPPMAQAMTNR